MNNLFKVTAQRCPTWNGTHASPSQVKRSLHYDTCRPYMYHSVNIALEALQIAAKCGIVKPLTNSTCAEIKGYR